MQIIMKQKNKKKKKTHQFQHLLDLQYSTITGTESAEI